MTDRPIIFSAPMVHALLKGRKTQTRRRKRQLPPAVIGDRLWVREAMCWDRLDNRLFYRADNETIESEQPDGYIITRSSVPSIFMPRWASRLTLTVTNVRAQRLQDISKEDVIAEGITERDGLPIEDCVAGWHEPYAALWNSLHGPGAWDANPFVIALTFTVAHGNIDALPQRRIEKARAG